MFKRRPTPSVSALKRTAGGTAPAAAPPPDAVQQRLAGAFGSAFLTLYSIVQGLVLAYLATQINANYQRFGALGWILSANTLAIAVLLWNETWLNTLALVWIPTLLDAALPFALGVTQLLAAHAIYPGISGWLLFVALNALVGAVALLNVYLTARSEPRLNQDALGALGSHFRIAIGFLLGACVLFGAAGLVFRSAGPKLTGMEVPVALGGSLLLAAYAVRAAVDRQALVGYLMAGAGA